METYVGYYNQEFNENTTSPIPFFVHCCGRYRLITRERFFTERKSGYQNYQLLYIASGKASFEIGGKKKTFTKGHAMLYRPGETQYYEYLLQDQPNIYWVHFSAEHEENFFSLLNWAPGEMKFVGEDRIYIQIFESMIRLLQGQDLFYVEELQVMLKQLLIRMGRQIQAVTKSLSSYDTYVEEILRTFHERPEYHFQLKDFCREKGINYCRFIDRFTQETGISPKQYQINVRMLLAKDLLRNGSFNVGETAAVLGYDNPLYFSRLFKKHWGQSPRDYSS